MQALNLIPRVLLETKVPWWIVDTWFRFIAQILGNKTVYYCIVDVPGLKLTPFNSVQTCQHILLSFPPSLKINCFIIAQNVGNKAKPRDHDPPGYFRFQKYPGYEVGRLSDKCLQPDSFMSMPKLFKAMNIFLTIFSF